MKSRRAYCLSLPWLYCLFQHSVVFLSSGRSIMEKEMHFLQASLVLLRIIFFLQITVWLSRLVMRSAEQQRSIYYFTCFAPKQNGSPSSLLKACLEAQIAASSLLLSPFSLLSSLSFSTHPLARLEGLRHQRYISFESIECIFWGVFAFFDRQWSL